MIEFNGLIFGHERDIKDIQIPRKNNWINYEESIPQTKNMQDREEFNGLCVSGLCVKAKE